MLLVDRQTVPAPLHEESSTRLKLRVRGDSQLIQLAEGKTTIGSSPRCNLRLDRPGVEPLHCLVVDGPEGMRVRRWGADTRLNGAPVEDARLEAGDCLSLGGVELDIVGPLAATELIDVPVVEEPEEVVLVGILSVDREPADDAVVDVSEPLEIISRLVAEENRELHAEQDEYCPAPAAIEDTEDEMPRDDLLPAKDAAEMVFRQLQSACAAARGRNRKMLAALRSLRTEKETLARQLENGAGAEELAQELAGWDLARQKTEQEQRELHVELKELRRQLGEWESRLAEHTQGMAALQQELAATRASGQPLAGYQPSANDLNFNEPTAQADESTDPQPATVNRAKRTDPWETLQAEPAAYASAEEAPQEPIDDVRSEYNQAQASVSDEASAPKEAPAAADIGAETADLGDLPDARMVEWAAPEASSDHEVTAVAAHSWDATENGGVLGEASSIDRNMDADAKLTERTGWEIDGAGVPSEVDDAISPFAEFSIWKQGAAPQRTGFDEAVTAREEEPVVEVATAWGSQRFDDLPDNGAPNLLNAEEDSAPVAEANPWKVAEKTPAAAASEGLAPEIESPVAPEQSTSFIERYSHLFADEGASPADKVEPPISQLAKATPLPAPGLAGSAATGSDDEESIEQYMAKLMKRVRGDSPVVAASQVVLPTAPTSEESRAPAAAPTSPEPAEQKDATGKATEASKPEEEHADAAVNWDAFVRRAATAPATNLGALRALANETARRDISVHRLKKHRGDAVTKVIVSMLAGMTSLWLMLDAENWRNVQFITACISLLVAAWWAGEAFREMLRSMRVTYVGPGAGEVDAALPIDVED